jgi:hypothetical protein
MNVNSFLEHFGILGMKWGRRRGKTKKVTKGYKRSRTKESLETISDDDLKKIVTRLSLEKQYKDITAKQKSRGRKIAEELLETAIKRAGTAYLEKIIAKKISGG